MNTCKLVYVKKTIKDKVFKNYYLQFDNGYKVAIKPSFVNDYSRLSVLAVELQENE